MGDSQGCSEGQGNLWSFSLLDAGWFIAYICLPDQTHHSLPQSPQPHSGSSGERHRHRGTSNVSWELNFPQPGWAGEVADTSGVVFLSV